MEAQVFDKIIFDSLQKLEARITPKGLQDAHPFQSFVTLRPVSEKDSVPLELAEYQYENGARVFLMNTPYEKNKIHLKAISWGGYSLYDSEEDRKLVNASPFISNILGVGDLSKKELDYLLFRNPIAQKNKTKNIGIFQINELNEQFDIEFEGERFETVMKVVYNYFTNYTIQGKKQFNDEPVNKNIRLKLNKSDSVITFLENEHLVTTNCTIPDWDNSAKFARAHQLFKERFADGGDFTFVFVGDFSKAQNMVGVFNKYIGNLPKDDKGEFCKFLPTSLKKIPDLDYSGEVWATTRNRLHYEDSTQYNAENIIDALYMTKLYNYNVKKFLNKEHKGIHTYMENKITHYPFAKLSFDVTFGNYQIKDENSYKSVGVSITALQEKRLNSDEISAFNSVFIQKIIQNSAPNDYYIDYLTQHIMEGLELDKLFKRGELEEYLKTFTPEKIQALAKRYWNVERRTKIVN